jgi:hypothetical protein
MIFNRKKSKVAFIFYSKDGRSRNIIYGKVVTSTENSSEQMFYLPKYKTKLNIRQPTCYIEGRPFREIGYDSKGEINYIEVAKEGIDNKSYLDLGLTPEEKIVSLQRYKDNRRRYEQNLNKWQTISSIIFIIIMILAIIGVIVMTIQMKKIATENVEAAKIYKEIEQSKAKDIEVLNKIAEYQLQVMSSECGEDLEFKSTVS